MVLHADPGRLWLDKVVAVVKTKRLREREINLAKVFENYSVETDLDYTGGCQEFSSETECLVNQDITSITKASPGPRQCGRKNS